jgi:hypothetical protein
MKRTPTEAGSFGHGSDAAMPQAAGFRSRPPPEPSLIEASLQGGVFLAQPLHIDQHEFSIAQADNM